MSSDEDEDDYSFYGTGLEPIEEDEIPKKKPFAIENQVVLDQHGKRRFHGAFTGGFTAGYCNTVGSSEGWTPSTFKSSRTEKASLQSQKPEDFMDDEDVGEFGIAPRVLRATSDYRDPSSSRKRSYIQPSDGPIPGKPVMFELLKPTRETIGTTLLRQMGWKPGQGVGPRLSHKEKREQQRDIRTNKSKVYGCSLPNDGSSNAAGCSDGDDSNNDEDDDERTYLDGVTFAPDDYDPYLVKPKIDRFGIGYSGLDKRPVLSGHLNLFEPSFLGMEEKKRKVAISGQAFGVGAFEEEDADIYARDDMSQYDFALETSESIASSKRLEREAEKRRMLSAGMSTSGLHGNVLEGFTPANHPLESQRKFFPPPTVPNDFVPSHSVRKSRFEASNSSGSDESASRRQGLQRHDLNANTRAVILDAPVRKPMEPVPIEKPVDPQTLKPMDSTPIGKPADSSPVQADAATSQIKSEPLTPTTRTTMFRPFAQNPLKQARYEQFLDLSKRGLKDTFSALQPSSMTEWDKEQERSEFEQASQIYKPLTGFMSDRFVSASQNDDTLDPLATVGKTQHGAEDVRAAAKAKMFGKLTRKITTWNPCAIVCKRFNVPQPAHSAVPETKKKARFSVFDYLDASAQNTSSAASSSSGYHKDWQADKQIKQEPVEEPPRIPSEEAPAATPSPAPIRPKSRWDCPPITADEGVGEETVSKTTRPIFTDIEFPEPPVKADLFKAIFLSSSEDSDSDSESEKSRGKIPDAQRGPSDNESTDSSSQSKSLARNMSPPRGIFANLDLDAINSKRSSSNNDQPVPADRPKSPAVDERNSDLEEEMMYGPKLPNVPTASRTALQSTPLLPVFSEGKWVEKRYQEKHHKHSKHKKDKKHKKHKSKKQKRKK